MYNNFPLRTFKINLQKLMIYSMRILIFITLSHLEKIEI